MAICALFGLFTPGPPVKEVQARLQRVTRHLRGVKYSLDESGELTVSYRVHQVQHHAVYKTGVKAAGTYTAVEPRNDGFLLTTYVFDHKPSEPARAFQAVLKAGTGFEFGDYQIKGKDQAVYINLHWGPQADPSVVERIRKAVTEGTRPLP